MSLNIIKDYAPNLLNLEDMSDDSESDDQMSNESDQMSEFDQMTISESEDRTNISDEDIPHIPDFYNPLEYFDEITSLNKLDVRAELKEDALPVPMDYFKRDPMHKLRQIMTKPKEILSSRVAEEYNLQEKDLAVTEDNYHEVEKYLFTGQPIEITPDSIESGVIGAGENFLVLVGCPNKHGYPGRLFILYSRGLKSTSTTSSLIESFEYIQPTEIIIPPTPSNMEAGLLRENYRSTPEAGLLRENYRSTPSNIEAGLLRDNYRNNNTKRSHPLEYRKTMRDISQYDQSLVGQTLESIDGLREIVSSFFMVPVFEKHHEQSRPNLRHQRPTGIVYDL